jgi:hypothetical protein
MYNRASLRAAGLAFVAVSLITNAALLLPGVGSGFVTMVFSTGLSTPVYYYVLIPLLTILSITVVNVSGILAAFGRSPKPASS